MNPRERRQLLLRRRRLLPKPEADPNGMWVRDPDTGAQVFLPFELLHQACVEGMWDEYIQHFEAHGCPRWQKDPTYHMRRTK